MKVKLSDIIDALESTDQYTENFLDAETGEIIWLNDMTMNYAEKEEASSQLDEHGFYRLPTSFELNDYEIMEEFIYTLPAPAQNRLERAIQGKGAFGRFKDIIYQLGIEDQWYKFQESEYRKKAIEWCVENGLEYDEE